MGYKMKKYIFVMVIFFVFVAVGISKAQEKSYNSNTKIGKIAKANLVMALMSDNTGLRNSAIEFVRKYNLDEVIDALKDVLENDESNSAKVMAAVTLYQIGSAKSKNAIFNSKLWNEREFIKKFNTALLIN